jgi:tRNA A37 threonylcarbamoyltransferase TsaD
VCTYTTETASMDGSAKGPGGAWFHVTDATVYYDHPVHAMADHTLNVDLAAPSRGPGARVALELTASSARELVTAIEAALAAVPRGLLT